MERKCLCRSRCSSETLHTIATRTQSFSETHIIIGFVNWQPCRKEQAHERTSEAETTTMIRIQKKKQVLNIIRFTMNKHHRHRSSIEHIHIQSFGTHTHSCRACGCVTEIGSNTWAICTCVVARWERDATRKRKLSTGYGRSLYSRIDTTIKFDGRTQALNILLKRQLQQQQQQRRQQQQTQYVDVI